MAKTESKPKAKPPEPAPVKSIVDMAAEQHPEAELPLANNNASASRDQVPPGQSAPAADAPKHQEIIHQESVPGPNDAAASRNQIPPGQPKIAGDVQSIPLTPQPATSHTRTIEEQPNALKNVGDPLAKQYRAPQHLLTDGEAIAHLESRYPGVREKIQTHIDAEREPEQLRLEKLHGPGYIVAKKAGEPETRIFSRTTWEMLGKNDNSTGWRQVVQVPKEVEQLANRR